MSGTPEAFTWDVAEGLPVPVVDGTTSYVIGLTGLPMEEITGSTVYYFHEDQLGSTRALTDSAGVVQQTYDYDPYGNLLASVGSVSNPLRYTGQFSDPESGLIYLRARYYDPSTASFGRSDPARTVTRQTYVYAAASPLNRVDPSGMVCYGIQGGASGIFGSVVTGGMSLAGMSGTGIGICSNGDFFIAAVTGGIAGGKCSPFCIPKSGAEGIYGSCGMGQFVSPNANSAQGMANGFQHSTAGVGAGAGGDVGWSGAGNIDVYDENTLGISGGAGLANYETNTNILSVNPLTAMNDPLVRAATAVGSAWRSLWG